MLIKIVLMSGTVMQMEIFCMSGNVVLMEIV